MGIGTTSPDQFLTILGGNISIQNNLSAGGADGNGIKLYGNTGNIPYRSVDMVPFIPASAPGVDHVGLNIYTSNGVTNRVNAMSILDNGNIGIGTTAPRARLDVEGGSAYINLNVLAGLGGQATISNGYGNQNGAVRLNFNNGGAVSWIKGIVTGPNTNTGSAIAFGVPSNTSDGVEAMRINANGNLLIGQTAQVNTTYKLDVAGSIRANEIVVNTSGADFVFDPTYKLPSISSLKKFIDKNHHLPEIPSAKQMQIEGLSVGGNQIKLLQKVEELTLYLIEKDKQITSQRQKLTDQQQQLTSQQEQINSLKQQFELIANKLK